MDNRYEKLKIALRYFLLGKSYFLAADALEFAASYHVGLRKDNKTPEFQHQIEIAHYLRTLLPSMLFPQETLTAALLHDVTEDYAVADSVIGGQYGEDVGKAVFLLNKNNKLAGDYFDELALNPIGSIVKGADRIHNLQTMIGVFSHEKQVKYIDETETYFMPMLKDARRNFPFQEAAYENIKHVLRSQVELIEAVHASVVMRKA